MFVSRRSMLIVLALLLVCGGLLGAAWYTTRNWAPKLSDFPVQGLSVSESNGAIDWPLLRSSHADFAYVRSSAGDRHRDARFAVNWASARDGGMRYGASHDFSLCSQATPQATLFMTTVPRDSAALPPVVHLAFSPDCAARPPRDAVLSELNIFLNLVEGHSGKPALLRVSQDFEEHYDIGGGINRTLWLDRNFLQPTYADHPWVMWTASNMRRLDGIDGPVEWDVVAP